MTLLPFEDLRVSFVPNLQQKGIKYHFICMLVCYNEVEIVEFYHEPFTKYHNKTAIMEEKQEAQG